METPLTGQTLRGIAHPLRLRLLNLLRVDGPSTATRLAERTGQSSGSTSYHLRQLARHGFVEEDPTDRGGGRERWWRAAIRKTSLEAETLRSAPVEAEAYLRAVAGEYAARVDRWLDRVAALPSAWDQAATLSNWRLRLTVDEATRLLAELEAVADRYRRDEPDDTSPAGTERVALQIQFMPFLEGSA